MLSRSVACPVCGQPAIMTLYERAFVADSSEEHEITFACSDRGHLLTEAQRLALWAHDHSNTPLTT